MAIPSEYQTKVDRLRNFLNDTKELNDLKEVQESTDEDLYYALLDAYDEINYEYVPAVEFSDIDDVPFNLLKQGATLQILTSKGILSARNTLSFSDSGGITVKDHDTYGRYINYFNVLVNKFVRGVTNYKLSKNANDCYGGVHSEYANLS